MPLLPSNIANLHLYGIRLPLYACLRNQGSAKDKISRDARNSIDNMSSRSDYLSHNVARQQFWCCCTGCHILSKNDSEKKWVILKETQSKYHVTFLFFFKWNHVDLSIIHILLYCGRRSVLHISRTTNLTKFKMTVQRV